MSVNRLFRSSRARQCRGGFTLIELLVVVSIIALLITILIPTLDRAREQAYSAVCRSNLAQCWKILQAADGNKSMALPNSVMWRDFITQRGGRDVLFCPKDRYHEMGWADLEKMYFVQNGRTFCYLPDLMSHDTSGDSQIGCSYSNNVATVWYGYHAGSPPNWCAKVIITLGDPIKVEVPDHLSHEEANGGCASHHYVCYDRDDDGHDDWRAEDFVCELKGEYESGTPCGVPGTYYVGAPAGDASYAMNVQVPSLPARPSQILLLDYEKGAADADGSDGEVDDWDQELEPATKRHMGKVNVVTVEGRVYPATREELEWERDRDNGNWNP